MTSFEQYLETPDNDAITAWMQRCQERSPHAGVLALVPEDDRQLVDQLQGCANAQALALVGGVFPELVVQGRFVRRGVLLCAVDPMPPYVLRGNLSRVTGRVTAVSDIAAMVDEAGEADADGTLVLMFDGLFGLTASMLTELYYQLGDSVRYAGVNSGSETFKPMPCLFDGKTCTDDAVLAMYWPHHPGAVLVHGYQVPETSHTATAAANNRIVRIGLEPAFAQYAHIVREKYGQEVTRENFYSMGVHFPFALIRASGELLIRIPVAVDDEGALFCVGEVPEGAMLTVARAVEPGDVDTVNQLASQYAALRPEHGLFFYCAGRRMHMGADAAQQELAQLARALPQASINGALTLGEIGNSGIGGYPLFHNATLVALPTGIAS